MNHVSLWGAVASRCHRDRHSRLEERRTRHMRRELERLLSLGDYLIQDIGLDPKGVREWLENESGETRYESNCIPRFPRITGVRPA